jgi:hypothetical protein
MPRRVSPLEIVLVILLVVAVGPALINIASRAIPYVVIGVVLYVTTRIFWQRSRRW